MFREFKHLKTHHQVIFALIIGFAVISFWRGVWGLWDVYVLPNDYKSSLWLSLVVGLGILAVTHYVTKELA